MAELLNHDGFINIIRMLNSDFSRSVGVSVVLSKKDDRLNDPLVDYLLMNELTDEERENGGIGELNENHMNKVNAWKNFWDYLDKYPSFKEKCINMFEFVNK